MEETKIKLSVPLSEDVIKLSVLDQQIMRFYPKTLLIFERDSSKDPSDIVHHLKQGLAVALSEYPDFATTVAPVQNSQRKDLELRISHDSGVPFKVVDQTKQPSWSYGSYSDLAAKHFPVSDIPHDTLFIPQPAPAGGADGLPATFLQINIIEGGIIIAISWHHAVCDASGMGIFTDAWARHTQTSLGTGKPALPNSPAEGTRDRWRLDHGHRGISISQLPEYTISSSARDDGSESPLLDRANTLTTPYAVSTWYLSSESLKSLRQSLSQTGPKTQFTKVEAVSALVWKHLSIARELEQKYPEGSSLFTTRLDFRARTKPPFLDTFVGNINEPTARVRMPLAEICSASSPESLTILAEAVRAATESTTEQSMRTLIGLVNDAPAVTDVSWNYNYFPGPDLGVTDISNIEAMKQSWGAGLGAPKCIRSYSRENGLLYLLPLDQEGGFEIQVQCEREALERLQADGVFGAYCEFRRVEVYNEEI
ncbi:hypothetical protein BDW74DRAFT_170319 [Aspergillus multicolor]|uniref:uncharacterized protein n=1 Tax=Aspergillus multicolor TaxID=41759 RepID=UPI003CCDD56B